MTKLSTGTLSTALCSARPQHSTRTVTCCCVHNIRMGTLDWHQLVGWPVAPTCPSSSCCRVSNSSACLSSRSSFVARLLRAHSCWQAAIPVDISAKRVATLLLFVMKLANVRLLTPVHSSRGKQQECWPLDLDTVLRCAQLQCVTQALLDLFHAGNAGRNRSMS